MNIIVLSVIAGVAGMGLGGLLTALFGSRTERMTSIFLSFASGVMLSIVFLELIPESIGLSNLAIAIIGLILGVFLVLLLNYMMDRFFDAGKGSKLHETFAEFYHSSGIITKKTSMLRSGIVMFLAIALHNIPEGLAMGAASDYDPGLGLTLAIIIGLHNIPEGMAVAAPLISGGLTKKKSVILTLLAGTTTIVGALAGYIIGGISDVAVAISFSIAGGAMLGVVIGEILPQTIVSNKDRVPTIFALAGIVTGMLFIGVFAH